MGRDMSFWYGSNTPAHSPYFRGAWPAGDLFDVFSQEAAFITIYPLDMPTAVAPPFLKRSWPEALTPA